MTRWRQRLGVLFGVGYTCRCGAYVRWRHRRVHEALHTGLKGTESGLAAALDKATLARELAAKRRLQLSLLDRLVLATCLLAAPRQRVYCDTCGAVRCRICVCRFCGNRRMQ